VARALGGVLLAVEAAMAPEVSASEGPLRWRDGSGTDRRVDEGLLELVLAHRERHDDGALVSGAASIGDLRARRGDGAWLTAVSWELGAESGGGSVRVRFDADSVGSLAKQSGPDLAALLCAVANAVHAVHGQVTTRKLSRALGHRGASLAVGALTLFPGGLPSQTHVPRDFSVLPATPGYPNGAVLVADLEHVTVEPESVADALAELDRSIGPLSTHESWSG
jgi:hypothetical protein